MFLGHFGVGFGGKAAAPTVSLGKLLLAAQFLDLLWPTLLLLGVEHVRIAPGITVVTPLDFFDYPVSHGLVAVVGWAVLVGGAYWLARGNRAGAVIVGALVVSHWVLDLLVHRADLPLAGNSSPHVGLGLWNSVAATLMLEAGIFAAGVWLYLRSTRAKDRVGAVGLCALVALLVLIYAGNLAGPPPPAVSAIAWAGQAQWLLVAMGWWVDRHREARAPVRSTRL